MRFLSATLLCLLLSPAALPQTRQVLRHKGELEFGDAQERVLTHKLLPGENRLLLVGRKSVRVMDVAGAKFRESVPVEVPEFKEDAPRLISPDGRRMLVFGNYASKDKVKRPPTVWDLRTGKQLAVLDGTAKPIRAASWSKNGKTLATSSNRYAPFASLATSVEVSFWDGETYALKSSLPTDKVGWWHLSDDGDKCVYAAGEVKTMLLTRYLNPASPVSVWDVSAGRIEQAISAREANVEGRLGNVAVTPDEKFLFLITQPPKSKEAERRVSVWEIDKSNPPRFELRRKYELKPAPQIPERLGSFSPDGKYLTLDAGKTLQVYETRSGEKRFELPDDDYPAHWLDDNKILLFDYKSRLEAREAATGRQLYRQALVYYTESSTAATTSDPDDPGRFLTNTTVLDKTEIVPHPGGRMFLTYSKQFVQVYDSRTGELLQTLVSPPVDHTKKKPKYDDKPLVSKANWTDDGRTLYVIGADERTISLWELLDS
ncbi:MAG TPA: WD40 repeat domain-containing protein [Pyrinomonadaceae bacterium]|nr:WD40 repeat domain-containing protein [Pyrinomonadaceae bacterium]